MLNYQSSRKVKTPFINPQHTFDKYDFIPFALDVYLVLSLSVRNKCSGSHTGPIPFSGPHFCGISFLNRTLFPFNSKYAICAHSFAIFAM